MAGSDEGRTEYVRRRFGEAEGPEEVKRIREDLLREGIPRGTVDAVKAEMKKNGGLPEGGTLTSLKKQFPQRLGRYDVLTPEAVLQELRLQDGDYKVGFVDGIAMLLLAARLNQELAITQSASMQPMINMLQAMRQEEKEAAERARGSSRDIAQEAAHQTALEMADFIDQRIPKEPPPKSTDEMFGKRIDRMWDYMEHMMMSRMAPQWGADQTPEGWEVRSTPRKDVSKPASPGRDQPPPGEFPEGWNEKSEGERSDV